MKRSYLAAILILVQSPLLADNREEIKTFCSRSRDFQTCARSYKGLPPIRLLPSVSSVGPISLEVIPYSSSRPIASTAKCKSRSCQIKSLPSVPTYKSKRIKVSRGLSSYRKSISSFENSWDYPSGD